MSTPDLILSVDRVVALHREGIDKYGGQAGPPKAGCVDGSVGNAYQAALYMSDDDALDPLHYAAHVLFYLVSNHCFTDGNKRVGWMALVDLLLTHGLVIDATQSEAVTFVLSIARGERQVVGILGWLAGRLTAADFVEA